MLNTKKFKKIGASLMAFIMVFSSSVFGLAYEYANDQYGYEVEENYDYDVIDEYNVEIELNQAIITSFAGDSASGTWFETAWAIWQGSANNEVFVRIAPDTNPIYWRDGSYIDVSADGIIPNWLNDWTKVDTELVRLIDPVRNFVRVDIPGLPEGFYDIQVRAANGDVIAVFEALETRAFPRLGAAFIPSNELIQHSGNNVLSNNNAPYGATGGYLSDGRVDPNAVIRYITNDPTTWVYITPANLAINSTYRNGNPLIIRILGTVGDFDIVTGNVEEAGVNAPTGTAANRMLNPVANQAHRITWEGIGPDATIYGWGIFTNGGQNVVFRNFTLDLYWAFGIRASGNTTNFWAHNNTLRYGQNRFLWDDDETDRSMAQGVIDVEQWVTGYTISYNHFLNVDKTNLIVGGVQNQPVTHGVNSHQGTFHHNWYQGVRERNPRVRHHNVHMVNNLFEDILGHPLHYALMDRHTGYAIGAGHNATVWAEGNIFENVNFPFLRSRHGHARGYYPHTGHNHFFGDGPGFMITGENRLFDGTIINAPLTVPTDFGYRNSVQGDLYGLQDDINAMQPNIMDEMTKGDFDPTLDIGMTVDREATFMTNWDGTVDHGFPAVNANGLLQGWGFMANFRPSVGDGIWYTQTAEQVAALASEIRTYAGVMPSVYLDAPWMPITLRIELNEFDYFMHQQNSPMPSLRTRVFPNTFTLRWYDYNPIWTAAHQIQFNDNGVWRDIAIVPNTSRPNIHITQDITDFGVMVFNDENGNRVFVHYGTELEILYPRVGVGDITEADIPSIDNLTLTDAWVIAQDGGTYEFRIRAINDYRIGDSFWAHSSITVPSNRPTFDVVQNSTNFANTTSTATFTVVAENIPDGIYDISLSVPRSIRRTGFPFPAGRNFANSIFLFGNTPMANGVTNGNGGTSQITIADGIGTFIINANNLPANVYELVLTINVAGERVVFPFDLVVIGDVALNLPSSSTWFEAIYAVWEGPANAFYTVQTSLNGGAWATIDRELVRYIGDGVWRADAMGLAADDGQVYALRVLQGNTVIHIFNDLIPLPFERFGFAFYTGIATLFDGTQQHFPHGTTGGHNPDGTVAPTTEVWYITHENRHRLAELSFRTEPLVVRIVGTVGDATTGNVADLGPNLTFQYHLLIENSANITIEGVGNDAVIQGFGFTPSLTNNIIIRNLTFEHSRHDAIWLRGPSTHAWITHNTFTNSGDGASDVAIGATNFTISNNQYVGTQQTMLFGGNDGDPDWRATVHGNWFFHGQVRHALMRAGQGHVFNNFYDSEGRISPFGGGQGPDTRERASNIIEGNFFQDTNNPFHHTTAGGGGNAIVPELRLLLPDADAPLSWQRLPNLQGGWHLTVENLIELQNIQNAISDPLNLNRGFGDDLQGFIDGLEWNHFAGNITNNLQAGLRRPFVNRNIGNISGGNNITPAMYNHFLPFNPHILTPVVVIPAIEVPNHVRDVSGPMRNSGQMPLPLTIDPATHIQTPVITQMHINPNNTFYIRTSRSPWATGYFWEWDQGNGNWEGISGTSGGIAVPSGLLTGGGATNGNAVYNFVSTSDFVASQGGTYQFRVTATNAGQSRTSEVFTITHNYVNMQTATPVIREDLTNIIFSEDFEGFDLGPVRNVADLEYLGIGVRRFQYLTFNRIINGQRTIDATHRAAGIDHEGNVNEVHPRLHNSFTPDIRRNDAIIINSADTAWAAARFADENGYAQNPLPTGAPTDMVNAIAEADFEGNSLMLRRWNWNNLSHQERYYTFAEIYVPTVMEGRVSINFYFMLNRSHENMGAGIHPIHIYDTLGNVIMRRNANNSPAINGETDPGLSLSYPTWQEHTNVWINLEVVLDFDEREFDVYINDELYEYNVPMQAHIQGLGSIGFSTSGGNHANSNMNLLIDNIVVATTEPPIPPLPPPMFPPYDDEPVTTPAPPINEAPTPPVETPEQPDDEDDYIVEILDQPVMASDRFDDVQNDAWYNEAITIVVNTGLFQGISANQFAPALTMTRAMFVQVLYNMTDEIVYGNLNFTDVASNAWYYSAINWAYNAGVVYGMSATEFAPNQPITREQMATMLHRFIVATEMNTPVPSIFIIYTDEEVISYWAASAVQTLSAIGLMQGNPDGSFNPQGLATRAEAATVFSRLLNIIE